MDAYRGEAMEILYGNGYVPALSNILGSTEDYILIPGRWRSFE
jgi:hypothetical protein